MNPACMICGATPAPFGIGWPGLRADQPRAVAGKRLRLCAFNGDCHAQGIARAVKAALRPWPWKNEPQELRDAVEAILGSAYPAAPHLSPPRAAATPERPAPRKADPAQASLF